MVKMHYQKKTVALALQMLALFIYIYIGVYLYDFPRKLEHYFLIIGFALTLDQLLYYADHRKFKLLFSPIITGSAVFMLVTSFSVVTYLIAIFAAITSKYLIRVRARHIFNPANFGVLFIVIFFKEDIALAPGQWGVENIFILVAALMGLLASAFASRLTIAFSYMFAFAILAAIKSYLYLDPILFTMGSLFGMSGIIFQFHMITDPQTTPDEFRYQVIFGVCVAVLDFYLRSTLVIFSQFISLSIICALYGLCYKKNESVAIS